jgi:hypothetical protein
MAETIGKIFNLETSLLPKQGTLGVPLPYGSFEWRPCCSNVNVALFFIILMK